MPLARVFLFAFGAVSLVFGVAYLVSPAALTEAAEFGALAPAAATDVRATYGGFQIGMGIFLVWSALDPARHVPALFLSLLVMGLIFSSRLVGVVLDGDLNAFHTSALVFESLATALAAFVWRRAIGSAG